MGLPLSNDHEEKPVKMSRHAVRDWLTWEVQPELSRRSRLSCSLSCLRAVA